MPPLPQAVRDRRAVLSAVARETKAALPDILRHLPRVKADNSEKLGIKHVLVLDPANCPGFPLSSNPECRGTRVRVMNEDTLDAAYVVLVRSSMSDGHRFLVPQMPITQLPIVSIISVAAIRRPALRTAPGTSEYNSHRLQTTFKYPADRQLTKKKMRLALRIAAHEKHELLVLGALGCGAFRNPPEEVARCWSEVLDEIEFRGGWWREIWFAVLDTKNEGNFNTFDRVLGEREFGVTAILRSAQPAPPSPLR
ncbi:hypothetical protein GGR58DRAFT_502654 [Xylaria digitata]|nr:hypothetical protein GGR58DRAFT_502654 [Xylaria digitata]